MKKRSKRRVPHSRDVPMYTTLEITFASKVSPMPQPWRERNVANMRNGLEALRTADAPTPDDWSMVADSLNLMETMQELGWLDDVDGNLPAAEAALAEAGTRHIAGKALRLDGPGIAACEALIDAYEEVIAILSEQSLMIAVVETERRVRALVRARKKAAA